MKIKAKFSGTKTTFDAKFLGTKTTFDTDFGNVQKVTEYVGGEKYQGEYEITPKVEAQMLPTAQKVLEENIVIKEIPFFNVSNTSGGSTVYIGNEV